MIKIQISTDKKTATIDGVEYELKQARKPAIQCITCGKEQYPCDHNEGKKISEWLNELPDGYRELALANFKEQGRDDLFVKTKAEALYNFCGWAKTKEFESNKMFWSCVWDYTKGITDLLPPLPKPKFEVWKPKVGDVFWFVSIAGYVYKSEYKGDTAYYNYFKTREQAIEAHEKAMFNYEVEMFIKEKNEWWFPDFTNEKQKHFLAYSCFLKQISIYTSANFRHTSVLKYFKSHKIGEEIIAKFDNEKLIKWWI